MKEKKDKKTSAKKEKYKGFRAGKEKRMEVMTVTKETDADPVLVKQNEKDIERFFRFRPKIKEKKKK